MSFLVHIYAPNQVLSRRFKHIIIEIFRRIQLNTNRKFLTIIILLNKYVYMRVSPIFCSTAFLSFFSTRSTHYTAPYHHHHNKFNLKVQFCAVNCQLLRIAVVVYVCLCVSVCLYKSYIYYVLCIITACM